MDCCKCENFKEKTKRKDGFEIGHHVYIYDRYRFAKRLLGVIIGFAENNDGVRLTLLESNSVQYKVTSEVWVHSALLRSPLAVLKEEV